MGGPLDCKLYMYMVGVEHELQTFEAEVIIPWVGSSYHVRTIRITVVLVFMGMFAFVIVASSKHGLLCNQLL